MNKLYHGSIYKNKILKPGFNYTGKELSWDDTETNKNLYASDNKESAILMGISSLLSKEDTLKQFSIKGNLITVLFYPNEKQIIINNTDIVYLYAINPLPNQKWDKVENKNNKQFSEFKTTNEIKFDKIETIYVLDWLNKNGYVITYVN